MHSSIPPRHTLSLPHTMGSDGGRATQGGSGHAKGGARDPGLALKLGGIGFQQQLKVSIHVLVYYLCRGWPLCGSTTNLGRWERSITAHSANEHVMCIPDCPLYTGTIHHCLQGLVTPIGAVVTAATGVKKFWTIVFVA